VAYEEPGRRETELERLDRNLGELVAELRVAQTGVQILFAFLLILPFSARFGETTDFERAVYLATLVFTGASAGLLIAPSAHHRLLFRADDKRHLVFRSNRLMILGLASLALAMSGAVLLVVSFVYGTVAGAVVAVFSLTFFTGVWYAQPLRRRQAVDGRRRR
jgi:hypothetical protein